MENVFRSIGVRFSKNGKIVCNGKNWKIIHDFIKSNAEPRVSGSVFDGMTDGMEDFKNDLVAGISMANKIMERGGFDRGVSAATTMHAGRMCNLVTVRDCTSWVHFYIPDSALTPCR